MLVDLEAMEVAVGEMADKGNTIIMHQWGGAVISDDSAKIAEEAMLIFVRNSSSSM